MFKINSINLLKKDNPEKLGRFWVWKYAGSDMLNRRAGGKGRHDKNRMLSGKELMNDLSFRPLSEGWFSSSIHYSNLTILPSNSTKWPFFSLNLLRYSIWLLTLTCPSVVTVFAIPPELQRPVAFNSFISSIYSPSILNVIFI